MRAVSHVDIVVSLACLLWSLPSVSLDIRNKMTLFHMTISRQVKITAALRSGDGSGSHYPTLLPFSCISAQAPVHLFPSLKHK